MKEQYMNSVQTSINSPFKPQAPLAKHSFIKTGSPYTSTSKMSETEIALYAHGLIREVMEATHLKSVWHQLQQVNPACKFYAEPRQYDLQQFKFNSIPPENTSYASTCSRKVDQIANGLAGRSNKSLQTNTKLLNKSISAHTNKPSSKISVSGLVDYKFRSVSAQKSIGYNKRSHETILEGQKQRLMSGLHCSSVRQKKALSRTSKRRYNQECKLDQVIMQNMSGDTSVYLRDVLRAKKENTMIYNEQMKKIQYIKEYMTQQGVDYQEAAHVVNAIQATTVKVQPPILAVRKSFKVESHSDHEFQRSRKPLRNKPVLLRYFHFIE